MRMKEGHHSSEVNTLGRLALTKTDTGNLAIFDIKKQTVTDTFSLSGSSTERGKRRFVARLIFENSMHGVAKMDW